jgi:putative endonuclease
LCKKSNLTNRRPFTFYILLSLLADKFYVSHTSEPSDERIRKHNSDHNGFTGRFQDWKLVCSESYASKELAYAREREVKAWKSKKRIQSLIAGTKHPG